MTLKEMHMMDAGGITSGSVGSDVYPPTHVVLSRTLDFFHSTHNITVMLRTDEWNSAFLSQPFKVIHLNAVHSHRQERQRISK